MAKVKDFFSELFKYKKYLIALVFILSITGALELGAIEGRAQGIADAKFYYTSQNELTSYFMNEAAGKEFPEPQTYNDVSARAKSATENAAAFQKIKSEIEHSKATISK